MSIFSRNTSPTGDGLAALAILRALIRALRAKGLLDDPAINAVMNEAHAQLQGQVSAASNDAREIISDLGSSTR